MVRRELAADIAQRLGIWLTRRFAKRHARLSQRFGALAQVTRAASRNYVLPTGHPARRARYNVVECKITTASAILALKFIPQKQIKAREGHALSGFYIVFQNNDRGYSDLGTGTADNFVILGNDIDPVQPGRFDRLLPGPQRQWIIGQGAVIGVQNQCRMVLERTWLPDKFGPEISVHSRIASRSQLPVCDTRAESTRPSLIVTIYRVKSLTSPEFPQYVEDWVSLFRNRGMTVIHRLHRIRRSRYGMPMSWFIRFNKPFDVLPQFTDRANAGAPRSTLSDFIDLPGVYPAGRLDRDSEGLMLLTDEGRLQAQISDPKHKMVKTYWVQVEGKPDVAALKALRDGVELKDGLTRPAKVRKIDEPPMLWPRTPPIRERKTVPDSWIELTLREGKNRQVRRMTAAVGLPTLRLIRYRIGDWTLDDLAPGQWGSLQMPELKVAPQRKRDRRPRR